MISLHHGILALRFLTVTATGGLKTLTMQRILVKQDFKL